MPDYSQTIKGRIDLATGKAEDHDGNAINTGFDEEALKQNLKAFAPKAAPVAGSYADLQILGARLAADSKDKELTIPETPHDTVVLPATPAQPPAEDIEVVKEVPEIELTVKDSKKK